MNLYLRITICVMLVLCSRAACAQAKARDDLAVKLEVKIKDSHTLHATLVIEPLQAGMSPEPVRVSLPGQLSGLALKNLGSKLQPASQGFVLELNLLDASSAGKVEFKLEAPYADGKALTEDSPTRFQLVGIVTELRLMMSDELIVPKPREVTIWLGKTVWVINNSHGLQPKRLEPDFDKVIEVGSEDMLESIHLRYIITGQLRAALVVGLCTMLLVTAVILSVIRKPAKRWSRLSCTVSLVLAAAAACWFHLYRDGSIDLLLPSTMLIAALSVLSFIEWKIGRQIELARWKEQSITRSVRRRNEHRNYQPLEFTLKVVASQNLEVSITSPTSREFQHTATIPTTRAEQLARALGSQRGLVLPSSARNISLQEHGETVSASVIQQSILNYFAGLYDSMQANSGIRICFKIADDQLVDIPWEIIRYANEYLALRPATPVLRLISHQRTLLKSTIDAPLRILAVTCTPKDPNLAPIDAKKERKKVETALAAVCGRGDVELEWLEHATKTSLNRSLKSGYHVLHFIGHAKAEWQGQQGVLFLENDDGGADALPADVLAICLRDSGVRFLFLNACETGAGDGSVAKILVERAVPAAIGMQCTVADDVAIALASEFYAALADGLPIDAALVEGRMAIVVFRSKSPDLSEWCTPVLYSQSIADCQLLRSR